MHQWLNKQLHESEKIICLLERIHSREDKLATASEVVEIKCFQDKLCEAFPDEVIALVLESKERKRLEKKLIYKPFLLKRDNKEMMEEFFCFLLELFSYLTPFHFDLILKYGAHCTAVQLNFDGETFRVFFVDAAGVWLNDLFLEDLYNQYPFDSFGVHSLKVQRDQKNCSIFSIQHLNKLSYHSDTDLSAVFFKHSQRESFLKSSLYKDHVIHKNSTKTLQDHINQYSITMNQPDIRDGYKVDKLHNYSILFKRHQYLLAALNELSCLEETLSPADIEEKLYGRMDFRDKNIGFSKIHRICSIKEAPTSRGLSAKPSVLRASMDHVKPGESRKPPQSLIKDDLPQLHPNKKTNTEGLALLLLGASVGLCGVCSGTYLKQAIALSGMIIMLIGLALGHRESLDCQFDETEEIYENNGYA